MGAIPAELRAFLARPDPERTIGPFTLVRQLGRGGFAPVWLARETYGGVEIRTAAVKLFAVSGAGVEDDMARVVDEARALCRVEHPNVVRFFSLATDERAGVAGLAMEYVSGEPLDATLRNKGTLSSQKVVEIGYSIASALGAVHREGLVHRDVKPANVVDAAGTYKLIDFGISGGEAPIRERAKPAGVRVVDDLPLEASDTAAPPPGSSAATSGTMGYMDPECLSGAVEPTAASDLYALGVTLFECMTGRLPSTGTRPGSGLSTEILYGNKPPPSVATQVPDAPVALARLVDRLVAPSRAARPRSADAVANELLAIRDTLSGRARALPPEAIGPFRGLGRFEEADRDVYFGREAEVRSVVSTLHAHGLVALLGPSGSGKSSLARAGVLPAIRERGIGRVPATWRTVTLSPGVDPHAAVLEALEPTVSIAAGVDPHSAFGAIVQWAEANEQGIVLFVDQLEELVTTSERQSAQWTAELLALIGERPTLGVRALVAARRDLLDALLGLPLLGKALARGAFFVAPLTDAVWGDVLDQALSAYGYRFEDDAMREEILHGLAGSIDAMPLVQFALTELWSARDVASKTIPRVGLQAIGGIAGALEAHADATLAEIDRATEGGADLVRLLLLALTTPEGTRATRSEEQLLPAADRDRAVAVLNALESARLVVRDAQGYTLAHEALLTSWRRLADWVSASRDDRRLLSDLERAAHEWCTARDGTLLWRKRRLEAAEEAVARGVRVTDLLAEFLRVSRHLENRARTLAIGSAVGAVLLILVGGLAYVRAVKREQASTRAAMFVAKNNEGKSVVAKRAADARSRELTLLSARAALDTDPTLAIARLKELPVEGSDWGAARLIATVARANGIADQVVPMTSQPLYLEASGDGTRLVTSEYEGGVRVWNTTDWVPRVLRRDGEPYMGSTVAISSDGSRVAARGFGESGEIVVWDLENDGKPLAVFSAASSVRGEIRFTVDGSRLVAVHDDGFYVHDLSNGATKKLGATRGAAARWDLSLDGGTYAEIDRSEIIVWSVVTGNTTRLPLPRGATDMVTSADGQLVAVPTKEDIRVFDVATKQETRVGVSDARGLSFSRRGQLAIRRPHGVALWDRVRGKREVEAPAALRPGTFITRDDRRLVARTETGSLLIWDVGALGRPRVLRGPNAGSGNGVEELADGRIVIGSGRALRVWRESPPPARRIMESGGWLAAFSGDGRFVVKREDDRSRENVKLTRCELATGRCGAVGAGAPLRQEELRISHDGRRTAWLTAEGGIGVTDGEASATSIPGARGVKYFDASSSHDLLAFCDTSGRAFVSRRGGEAQPLATGFDVARVVVSEQGNRIAVIGAEESAVYGVASGDVQSIRVARVRDGRFDREERGFLFVAAAAEGEGQLEIGVWRSADIVPRTTSVRGVPIAMSFGARALVVLGRGASLDLVDADTGKRRTTPNTLSGARPGGVFSPDQRAFAFASIRGTSFCDVSSWGCEALPVPGGEPDSIGASSLAFADGGTRVLAARREGVDIVDDDLPREPQALANWLLDATSLHIGVDVPPRHCREKTTLSGTLKLESRVDRPLAVYAVDTRCNEVLLASSLDGKSVAIDIRGPIRWPYRVRDARTHELLLDYPGATTEDTVSLIIDQGYGYQFSEDELYEADHPPPQGPVVEKGRLSPDHIQAVVRSGYPRVRECHAAALKRSPDLGGTLTLRFSVTDDGQIGRLGVQDSSVPDDELVACTAEVFETLRFPKVPSTTVTVVYPIAFAGTPLRN